MSYIDAWMDREKDVIRVIERVNGERIVKDIPCEYTFYYDDPHGRYTSISGTNVSKITAHSGKIFRGEIAKRKGKMYLYESDVNQVFRVLETHYKHQDGPKLNIGFFDIEVAFDKERGYAKPWNTFSPITAISIHLSHLETLVCLALKPLAMPLKEAEEICAKFENTILFTDERELLLAFFDLIEDCDVLTGWNSGNFDIPYIINRTKLILGDEYANRMCLLDLPPLLRKYKMFNKEHKTYDLVGRIHMDYLDLFKKHNQQQLHSYRLDFVGEIEVGQNKVPYEGTLDELYNNDFEKFIDYSRQDSHLLYLIDKKNKFIQLANQIAHTNSVLIPTTMGSVQLIDQSIINEAHDLGFIVPDRKIEIENIEEIDHIIGGDGPDDDDEDDEVDMDGPVVGAYVAKPKVGLHKEIGSVDVTSLYPSTLRALNMGPETLMGQIRPIKTTALINERLQQIEENKKRGIRGQKKSEVWDGLFSILEYELMINQDENETIIVDFEDGEAFEFTGKSLYEFIFNPENNLCITANGTIFRTDKDSVIYSLLTRWFNERVEMKGKQSKYGKMADGVGGSDGTVITKELLAQLIEFKI